MPPWLEREIVAEEVAPKPEEIPIPTEKEEAPPAPEVIPPSWIESLKPLAESILEEEMEMALALEAEMALEEMPLEEVKPAEMPAEVAEVTPPPKPRKGEELLEAARLHAREGAWEEALRYYRKLARNKKLQEEVLKDLEEALERGVSTSGLFELLGDIYRDRGLLDKALEFYRKALKQ